MATETVLDFNYQRRLLSAPNRFRRLEKTALASPDRTWDALDKADEAVIDMQRTEWPDAAARARGLDVAYLHDRYDTVLVWSGSEPLNELVRHDDRS